jgi:hypothetical protein
MESPDTRRRRVGWPIILAACVMLVGIVTLLTGFTDGQRGRLLVGLVITGVGAVMGMGVLVLGPSGGRRK